MGIKVTEKCNINFRINEKLPLRIYFAYGLGHVLNDVCSAMWFSYLLVFFHLVLKFEKDQAAMLLLIGQVGDAISTPILGYNLDKDREWWIYRFGKRKIWYLLGTCCVITSFPFVFLPCIACESAPRISQMLYYSFFIIIFQLGWATVQVTHMALIPEITFNEHQRTRLAAVRNGATVIASVLVYLVTWEVLHMSGGSEKKVGPHDATKFQHITWLVMSLGIICSVLFYILIDEPDVKKLNSNDYEPTSFKELFLNPNLYLVCIIYTSSRLFINLTQVFISLYLSESLDMVASSLALVPLAIYVTGLIASFPIGPMTKLAGRKVTYITGAGSGILGCLWIQWGEGYCYRTYFVFIVSILLGVASSIVLVSSLDIATNLIGRKTSQGAFIYGIMSFADKFSNGIAVEIIEYLHKEGDVTFYPNVMTYVCGGSLILGSFSVLLVNFKRKPARKKQISTESFNKRISTIS